MRRAPSCPPSLPMAVGSCCAAVVPTADGHSENRYSTMAFGGGVETPVAVVGELPRLAWLDSVIVGVVTTVGGHTRFSEVDVRTGAPGNLLEIPDSVVADASSLRRGWAWIPVKRDRIIVMDGGQRHEYPIPAWYAAVFQISMDREHHRAFYLGYNASTSDTLGMGVLTLEDGKQAQWASHFAEGGQVAPTEFACGAAPTGGVAGYVDVVRGGRTGADDEAWHHSASGAALQRVTGSFARDDYGARLSRRRG